MAIFNVDIYGDTSHYYIYFLYILTCIKLQIFNFYLDFLALNFNFFIDFPANDQNNLLVNVFTTFFKTNHTMIIFA